MKILILDDVNEHSLGMSYARAFKSLGCDVEILNPVGFLEARKAWRWKLSRRVLERFLLRGVEEELLRCVIQVSPDVVWVGKGAWALPSFWQQLRGRAPQVITVCYNADDPITTYSRGANRPWVTDSVAAFDLFCTYKKAIMPELRRRGAREVLHVPFAWDDLAPTKPNDLRVDDSMNLDLVFVGNGDAHREQMLSAILEEAKSTDLRVGVFGRWGRVRSRALRGALAGRQASYSEMQRLVRGSVVSLNLLRRQNEGSHNMRTFEIAGAGGLMLSQVGGGQERWFEPSRSALYFSTAREAVEQTLRAREAPESTAEMKAEATAVARVNTYRDRAELLLSRIEEMRSSSGGGDR